MPQFLTPAGGFSNAIHEYLTEEEVRRQNDLENRLALQREKRLEQAALAAEQDRKAAMLEHEQDRREKREQKKQEDQDAVTAKREAAYTKRKAGMVPGDIPDARMVAESEEFGDSQSFPRPSDPRPAQMQDALSQMPPAALRLAPPSAPMDQAPESPLPQEPVARPYAGNPAQRSAMRLAGLSPDSPEFKANVIQSLLEQGKNPAAAWAKPETPPDLPVFRHRQGQLERQVGDQWVRWTSGVPKEHILLQEPQPKDTSVSDAINADRDDRRIQSVRDRATTELNTLLTPLESQMKDFDRLGALLNAHSAQADADAAVVLLKAVAGGQGSGLRLTRAEIDNTLKGRTKWETLESVMNQWSTTPQKEQIPETQRDAMRAIATLARKKAYDMHRKVLDARYRLVDTNDPKELNRTPVQLRDELFPVDSPVDAAKPISAADMIKQIRGK